MAEYQDLATFTRKADADLSGKQYHFMWVTANGGTNIASLDTTSTLAGVLQNTPQSNEFATVAYAGVGKIVAGASITEGAYVTCNGSGRAVTVTSGDMAGARVLQAAGADGEVVTAVYFVPFRWSGAA